MAGLPKRAVKQGFFRPKTNITTLRSVQDLRCASQPLQKDPIVVTNKWWSLDKSQLAADNELKRHTDN
jgi:hypothetical protein